MRPENNHERPAPVATQTSTDHGLPPKPEYFNRYTYARRSHWKFFEGVDVDLFGNKIDLDQVQLKYYQDLLMLRFIRDNIPPGSRILDVGGGISRILSHLATTYECWNIDKLEGVGNGPRAIKDPPYRLVRDYMGNFNPELPDGHFDLVFSISALEHVPQHDSTIFNNIINDIDRVLKPGGLSLHLFDIVLKAQSFWTNKFTQHIFDNVDTINQAVTPEDMRQDPDFYAMSEEAYNKTWLHTTGVPYTEHGSASSLNILWKKSAGAVCEADSLKEELNKPAFVNARGLQPQAQRGGEQSGLSVESECSKSQRPCRGRDDELNQRSLNAREAALTAAVDRQPTFFVVTPCLNAAATIDRTIESVVGQSGAFRIRYHVQDGGSTDGTIDKLRQWERRLASPDTPVKCLGVEFTWASAQDNGMYEALAAGLDSLPARADDILTWINGDDVITPGALATVAGVRAAHPAIQWLGGTVRVIDDGNCVVEERDTPLPTEVIREGLCDGYHWLHLQQEGMFFTKSLWFKSKHALRGFRLAGDWSLWREFARHAEYHQVCRPLGAFRARAGQLSVARFPEYEAEIEAALPMEKRRIGFDGLYAQRQTLCCVVIDPALATTKQDVVRQNAEVFFELVMKRING